MRPQEKQKQEEDLRRPYSLFSDVALLVCESRVPDPFRGKAEGPHCPGGKTLTLDHHQCITGNHMCDQATQVKEKSLELWSGHLPLCVQVIGLPTECNSANSYCPSGGLLLEKWLCQVQPRRNPDDKLLPGQFLLQAIRSHLHFSMLSAWLSKRKGKLPFRIRYLTSLPGEQDKELENDYYCYETHQFPSCQVGKALVLTVSVRSLPRLEEAPVLKCACENPSVTLSPSSNRRSDQEFSSTTSSNQSANPNRIDDILTNSEEFVNDQANETATVSHKGVSLVPLELPSVSDGKEAYRCSVENPLFSEDGHCDPDSLKDRMSSLCLPGTSCEKEDKKSPRRRRLRPHISDSYVINKTAGNVKFYISNDEQEKQDGCQQFLVPQNSSRSSRDGTNRNPACGCTKIQRKRLSQKILFSEGDDVILSEDDLDEFFERNEKSEFYSETEKKLTEEPGCSRVLRKTSLPEGPWAAGYSASKCQHKNHSNTQETSFASSSGHRPSNKNCLPRYLTERINFSRKTGLPLSSSPAPLKRNQHSFDYDTTLNSVVGIRSVFYHDHDSASSDSESGGSLCKSAPASTNLLGNFETLFNPQGTVVKMFVVRYDMSEMPPSCQTFVRQRTFFMPSSATLQDAQQNRSWLRYLIHLRFATSRSGKLYMHSDIRMLFSRKSELDANNLEREPGKCIGTSDAGNYELRSFTEMPKNPKFSPKKLGGQSRTEKES